ncbi:MAG: hypothetical protein ABIJ86_13435 [Spirochaetota bacterium]
MSQFPDFLQVRSEFLSAVVTAPANTALAFKSATRTTTAGTVRVSVERSGASFYVLFLRQRGGEYPYGNTGNIIVKRDVGTGFMQQIKWFLSDDGLSFITLAPRNERTFVDYVVAGSVVRSGFAINQLIYYFFMQPFTYLHTLTRASIDWSLVLGSPESARSTAEALTAAAKQTGSGTPGSWTPYGSLLSAARDLARVGSYLPFSTDPGAGSVEPSSPAYPSVVSTGDQRETVISPTPAWKPDGSLSILAAGALIHAGIKDGKAFIAHFDRSDGRVPLKLVIIPYRGVSGTYSFGVVDAESGKELDWGTLVRSRPEAWLRLVGLPLPK